MLVTCLCLLGLVAYHTLWVAPIATLTLCSGLRCTSKVVCDLGTESHVTHIHMSGLTAENSKRQAQLYPKPPGCR
jgi:hypothetical protein